MSFHKVRSYWFQVFPSKTSEIKCSYWLFNNGLRRLVSGTNTCNNRDHNYARELFFFLCAIFSEFTRTFWKMWELKYVWVKNLPGVWFLIYCVVHFPFAELDQVWHQVVPKRHLVGTVVRLDRRLNIWKIEHLFRYRRPLDSYACPDQSNVKKTKLKIFLNAKNIFNYLGNTVCAYNC